MRPPVSEMTYLERLDAATTAAKRDGLGWEDLVVAFRLAELHARRIVFGNEKAPRIEQDGTVSRRAAHDQARGRLADTGADQIVR